MNICIACKKIVRWYEGMGIHNNKCYCTTCYGKKNKTDILISERMNMIQADKIARQALEKSE